MTVQPLGPATALAGEPDLPAGGSGPAPGAGAPFWGAVSTAFEGAQNALGRADAAETAFASGRGGLQEMVLQRAQADVALSLAAAAASKTTQSLSTILGMQV